MAVSLPAHDISDLCLGKPALRSLKVSATIADALLALNISEDNFISIWEDSDKNNSQDCHCIGKVCMADVICYLCQEQNLSSPVNALQDPVSALLPKNLELVVHIDASSNLLEAIDMILQGAHNLVVPIQSRNSSNSSRRKQHQKASQNIHKGSKEFCWITQEDIIRFLLNSIAIFSTTAALSIQELGIINTQVLSIDYHSPASSAIKAISSSLLQQTSVAVVDTDGTLIGEISPSTLACCGEMVAAAIATLSAGELMAYIDCGGPPEDLVKVVEERLKDMNLEGMLEELSSFSNREIAHSPSSSDEECLSSPTRTLQRRHSRGSSYSARMVRTAEAIVCHPKSSLVAVMVQAITHRVNYVWVIEDDCSLVGIVTFYDMLNVFKEHLETTD